MIYTITTTMANISSNSPPAYVKLIRKDRTHNGLVLIEGLNSLKPGETFDPNRSCGPGGLYFCKEEDVGRWIGLYKQDLGFIATVTLCSDSTVITMEMDHKLKTDRFLLGVFQPIEDYLTAEKILHIVQQHTLAYIPHSLRTFNVCVAAVNHTWCAFEHVPNALRTPELCLAATGNRFNRRALCLYVFPHSFERPNSVSQPQVTGTTKGLCDRVGAQGSSNTGTLSCSNSTEWLCAHACPRGPSNTRTLSRCGSTYGQCARACPRGPSNTRTLSRCSSAELLCATVCP